MAELHSEEQNTPSILKIVAGTVREVDAQSPTYPGGPDTAAQSWQAVGLFLTSGRRTLTLLENEDCEVCREPSDEIEELVVNLEKMLAGKREHVFFEPAEPTFEMSFERTRRGGIKVEVWLDAGNGTTAIYTWDACGIRFYTTDDLLRRFVGQLKSEFK